MGSLRFRKQFKLAPGVKLNLNQQSASVTFGVRGARLTYNTKGQRTTSVGLPGTGLSYRDTRKIGSNAAGAAQPARSGPVRDVFRDPLWSTEVKGTALAIMFVPKDMSYDLWVCDGPWAVETIPGMRHPFTGAGCTVQRGFWRLAGRYGDDYFKARAAAEVWEAYLRAGGTVAAWLGQSKQASEAVKRFGRR